MSPASDVAAVILAGGRGRRLGGRVKPLIEVDGRSIVARQHDELRGLTSEILLSTNDPAPFAAAGVRLPTVADEVTGAGPLAGIHAAFGATERPWVLAIAGDLPYLSAAPLRVLLDARAGVDLVIPRIGGHLEPLLALYHRRCQPILAERLERAQRKAQDVAGDARLRVRTVDEAELRAVDPELRCLYNVNSPRDLP